VRRRAPGPRMSCTAVAVGTGVGMRGGGLGVVERRRVGWLGEDVCMQKWSRECK
jgi:hypothetical protein